VRSNPSTRPAATVDTGLGRDDIAEPLPTAGLVSGPEVGDNVTLTCTGYLIRLASVGAVRH
jgi:hypothetical protein